VFTLHVFPEHLRRAEAVPEERTSFDGAREILAIGALIAVSIMHTEAGAVASSASARFPPMWTLLLGRHLIHPQTFYSGQLEGPPRGAIKYLSSLEMNVDIKQIEGRISELFGDKCKDAVRSILSVLRQPFGVHATDGFQ
jgi:hypothetical protein